MHFLFTSYFLNIKVSKLSFISPIPLVKENSLKELSEQIHYIL